jgi:hypothetical protein
MIGSIVGHKADENTAKVTSATGSQLSEPGSGKTSGKELDRSTSQKKVKSTGKSKG